MPDDALLSERNVRNLDAKLCWLVACGGAALTASVGAVSQDVDAGAASSIVC